MGEYVSFLVSVYYEEANDLVKCAIKIHRSIADQYPDWCSSSFKKHLHALLPLHVQTIGPVVEVEDIFEVVDTKPR